MGFIAQFLAPFHPRRVTSLVKTRAPESPERLKVEEDATADVERIEQDDKYFGKNPPADDDGLLPPRHRPDVRAAIMVGYGQGVSIRAERHGVHGVWPRAGEGADDLPGGDVPQAGRPVGFASARHRRWGILMPCDIGTMMSLCVPP